MIIASCGDSFFYGSDLKSTEETWPCKIAQYLNVDFQCFAQPGVGNLHILQQIITAQQTYGQDAIYAINWTWIDRFDYVSIVDEKWHTVRPSLDDQIRDPLYYKYFHSELADKFKNLIYISQAIELLQGHRYIMTYMDHLMFDQQWHAPDYIQTLQRRVSPHLKSFNGQTFLEWSRAKQYPESPAWHPLEQAHKAAAIWWQDEFRNLL